MNRLHRLAVASVLTAAVFVGSKQSYAQLVVFDPNNYAQNVLTAARALQQINNQIASLQNQAQMRSLPASDPIFPGRSLRKSPKMSMTRRLAALA